MWGASALEIKSVAPKLLRAAVVSVSHHPRIPTSLAATLQSGIVLFWNTAREGLDGHLVVRSHTQALAHGSFHPYLSIFTTLSKGGLVNIWHVPSSGPQPVTDLSSKHGTHDAKMAQTVVCVPIHHAQR